MWGLAAACSSWRPEGRLGGLGRPGWAGPASSMTPPSRLQHAVSVLLKLLVSAYLLAIVAAVVVYKAAFLDALLEDPFFATYGLAVSTYLVSRFVLSLPYRPPAD